MAKARQIVKRRNAVRNIRKITQTMQLIATARYQKAYLRAVAAKPYVAKLTEMIQTLAAMGSAEHPLLRPNGARKTLLLTITANRGLCGSYNASVLRLAVEQRKQLLAGGLTPEIFMVGKKGLNYFKFLNVPVGERIIDIEDKIAYASVAALADSLMARYEAGELGRVEVGYMRFVSVSTQRPEIIQLLPIEPPRGDAVATKADFEYSPEPARLLTRLIPESVKIRLFQAFNDAIVSEQVARMVAMKAATDAAGDMIRTLSGEYNRARQSQITMELADIVGGAEAVQ
jgi:F-type H+-transporting ATPase subunit gamma